MSTKNEPGNVVVIDGWADLYGPEGGRAADFYEKEEFVTANTLPASLVIGDKAMPLSKVREMVPYMKHDTNCALEVMWWEHEIEDRPILCTCGLDTLKEELRTMGVDL